MIRPRILSRGLRRSLDQTATLQPGLYYSTKRRTKWYKYVFKSGASKAALDVSVPVPTKSTGSAVDQSIKKLVDLLKAGRQDPQSISNNHGVLRQVVLQLIQESPDHRLAKAHIPLVEMAFRLLQDDLSVTDVQTIFRAVGHDGSLIPTMYSRLARFEDQLSPADRFLNGLVYLSKTQDLKLLDTLGGSGAGDPHQLLHTILSIPGANVLTILRSLHVFTAAVHRSGRMSRSLHAEIVRVYVQKLEDIPNYSLSRRSAIEAFQRFCDAYVLEPTMWPLVAAESRLALLESLVDLGRKSQAQKMLRRIIQEIDPTSSSSAAKLLILAISLDEPSSTCQRLVEEVEKLDANPDEMKLEQAQHIERKELPFLALLKWHSSQCGPDIASIKDTVDLMTQHGLLPSETSLMVCLDGAAHNRQTDIPALFELIIGFFSSQYGIERDARAYSVQVQHFVTVQKLDTARSLFEHSLVNGCQWHLDDLEPLYRLIEGLCRAGVDSQRVFNIFQTVKRFSPQVAYETKTAMLRMFLDGNFVGDVGMLLQDELGDGLLKTDDEKERDEIDDKRYDVPYEQVPEMYEALQTYVLQCPDYQQAWEVYGYLNRYISVPAESYMPAMRRFCELQRPDAALKIFEYQRERHQSQGLPPPSTDTYTYLFTEFGRALYEDGVLALHTYLKMDMSIEYADMTVMNSVLGAYCELQDNFRLSETWNLIQTFPEGTGMNNDSVTIMIRHLTRSGLESVEQFWLDIPRLKDITLTEDHVRQYVIANCYHGYYMRALNIVQTMHDKYSLNPTADIVEALYNWSMLEPRRDQVREWAMNSLPEIWAELVERGTLTDYLLPEESDEKKDQVRALPRA